MAPVYEVRRWRLTAPMYDVRGTMYDCDYSARCAGRRRRERRLCTTEAPSGAYVRCTIWKFGEPPARGILRSVSGGGWGEQSAGVIRKISNFAEPFPRLCYLAHRQPHFLMHIRPKKKRSQHAAIGVQCGITCS